MQIFTRFPCLLGSRSAFGRNQARVFIPKVGVARVESFGGRRSWGLIAYYKGLNSCNRVWGASCNMFMTRHPKESNW